MGGEAQALHGHLPGPLRILVWLWGYQRVAGVGLEVGCLKHLSGASRAIMSTPPKPCSAQPGHPQLTSMLSSAQRTAQLMEVNQNL